LSKGKGSFGGEFGASHCSQWALCIVVEVCEPIKLLFGVVSWVGGGMGVLDGVHVPQGEGEFYPPLISMAYLFNRNLYFVMYELSIVKFSKRVCYSEYCR